MEREPARLRRSPLGLLATAAGPPWVWPGKLWRLARAVWSYVDTRGVRGRLERLRARGLVERVPTRVQLVVGSVDMLRFWISPAAADYYEKRGIHYGFHQLLRFLDEPASLTDPLGLSSPRDAIIGHVLQVVHANPAYDMQLLMTFEDGLEQMERQTRQVIDGTHPRARSIGAVVEEADYHERLLEHVRTLRRDGEAPPLIRQNIQGGPFEEIERTFGTLTGAMAYFCTLPTTWRGAWRHLRTVRCFEPRGIDVA